MPLPHERAELFLERLANVDIANDKKVRTFAKRFEYLMPLVNPSDSPDVIPPEARAKMIRENPAFADYFSESGSLNFKFGEGIKLLRNEVQPILRDIWKEPVLLLKESRLMLLSGTYAGKYAQWELAHLAGLMAFVEADVDTDRGTIRPLSTEKSLERADTLMRQVGPDGFLKVLLYALKHIHLLRYCANPGCKEPYFIARRHSQVFCSEPCAVVSQRESKLKWWREHGNERRKKARARKGKHAKEKKA